MRYQISGKQIDIGDALRTHVETELGAVVDKYAERPTDAQVVFSRNAHEFVAEAVVHLSTGMTAQARGAATEIYSAFDQAAERMEKQLRRYKRRLKNHHKDHTDPMDLALAQSYVLASDAEEELPEESAPPIIIAEMEARIPRLSVGDAVMQMELAGSPLLVFQKEDSEAVSVVYRRDDGNIGWIDTAPRAAES